MGSNLIDIPLKFLMPSSLENIKEIAFKTVPSVTKVEIKNVLQSMYGLEVEKVRTLNMQGKKKRRGGRLVARPNYKKAYITLKNPISIASDLNPAYAAEKERRNANKQSESSYVQEDDVKSHWLDNVKQPKFMPEKQFSQRGNGDISAVGTMGLLSSKSSSRQHLD